MTVPTHSDLQRDLGRMEATTEAMESRLDRIERLLEEGFKELREEIASLKTREAERSALEKAAVWLAGIIGAVLATVGTVVAEHFFTK